MQHSTPASAFADHAFVSILWAGDRHVLTLRDEVIVPPQAARSVLEGWGWVDPRYEGLVSAFRRHNVDLRPFDIWRRNDGVLIATTGASRRRRLMAEVNSALPEQVPQFRTLQRRIQGCALPQVCSVSLEEGDSITADSGHEVPPVFRHDSLRLRPPIIPTLAETADAGTLEVHTHADLAARIGYAEGALSAVVSNLNTLQGELDVWRQFVQDLRCEGV